MKQYIIKVPVDTELEGIEAVKLVNALPLDGEELYLALMDSNQALDFDVLAVEDQKVDQLLLLPFMRPALVPTEDIDDDGETIFATETVTDLTDKLHTCAGHKWSF